MIVLQQFGLLLFPVITVVLFAAVAIRLNETSQADVVANLEKASGDEERAKILAGMVVKARVRLGGSAAIAVVLLVLLPQAPGLESLFTITPPGTNLVHVVQVQRVQSDAGDLLATHLRPLQSALNISSECAVFAPQVGAAIRAAERVQDGSGRLVYQENASTNEDEP